MTLTLLFLGLAGISAIWMTQVLLKPMGISTYTGYRKAKKWKLMKMILGFLVFIIMVLLAVISFITEK
jgi:hypothetical protein